MSIIRLANVYLSLNFVSRLQPVPSNVHLASFCTFYLASTQSQRLFSSKNFIFIYGNTKSVLLSFLLSNIDFLFIVHFERIGSRSNESITIIYNLCSTRIRNKSFPTFVYKVSSTQASKHERNVERFTSRLQLANASPFHGKNWTVSTSSFLFPRPITVQSPSFSLFIPRYFPSPNRSPSRCAFHAEGVPFPDIRSAQIFPFRFFLSVKIVPPLPFASSAHLLPVLSTGLDFYDGTFANHRRLSLRRTRATGTASSMYKLPA